MSGRRTRRRRETGDGRKTEQTARSRLTARFERLRDRHDKCLYRYMEYEKQQTQSSGLSHQKGETLSSQNMSPELLTASNSLEKSSTSESNTEIVTPESSSSAVNDDPDVPPLERTDSTCPTGRPREEGETSSELSSELQAPCNSLETSSISESSTDMLTPESSSSAVNDDPDVPPLERTDSIYVIFLTKEDLDWLSKTPVESESMSYIEYRPSKDSINESCSVQIQISPDEKVLEAVDSDLSSFSCPSSGSSRGKRKMPSTESDEDITPLGSSTPRRSQRVKSDCDHPEEAGPSAPKRQTVKSNTDHPEEETSKRRTWTPAEVRAVEKTLKVFIDSGKVPRKADCVGCIKASPQELKTRTWTAVKYYVKNRIATVQRESAKRY